MELGLFPLEMVLVPTERIPLHIFEPRYQELIGECLDRDDEFGLVFADDDGIPLKEGVRKSFRVGPAIRRLAGSGM